MTGKVTSTYRVTYRELVETRFRDDLALLKHILEGEQEKIYARCWEEGLLPVTPLRFITAPDTLDTQKVESWVETVEWKGQLPLPAQALNH